MAREHFNWVKPYDRRTNEPISSGAGFFSGSNGFPLDWKIESSNWGRLKRRATYRFRTNDFQYTGNSVSKNPVEKYATILQHGLAIFDKDDTLFNLGINDSTIVFNLADSIRIPEGIISITNNAYTNALFFTISIAPAPDGDTWIQNDRTFTQVTWINTDELRKNYFNKVRETTYYRFLASRPDFYGGQNTYLEQDNSEALRTSYMFRMMYLYDTTKISTGDTYDITEYFNSDEGVTKINFDTLYSNSLQFTDTDGRSRTFREYYSNLLLYGEEDRFIYWFYTNTNPLIKEGGTAFSDFSDSASYYYIDENKMLHFTITIHPYGYMDKVDLITLNSSYHDYLLKVIHVYIINCLLEPYLRLNNPASELDYTSNVLDADEGVEDSMSVFSNMGWDITTEGSTEYFGYDSNE